MDVHLDRIDRCLAMPPGTSSSARLVVISVAVVVTSISNGCASLRNRNPIDEEVIIARQLSQQGVDARQDGDWTLAEDRFRSAIKYCPDDHTARVHYAECLWRRGEADEATQELAKAIDLSGGTDVDSIARLGEMLHQMGNSESAMGLVNRALSVNPKNPMVWKLRGSLLYERGQLNEALAAYHRALVYAPNDAVIQTATAEIYYKANRPHRAVAVLERLFGDAEMEQIPTRTLHLHGLALARLNRSGDAVQSLALARDSAEVPSSELLADLAESQIANDQISDASQTIDDAFRIANASDRVRLAELQNLVVSRRRENVLR